MNALDCVFFDNGSNVLGLSPEKITTSGLCVDELAISTRFEVAVSFYIHHRS